MLIAVYSFSGSLSHHLMTFKAVQWLVSDCCETGLIKKPNFDYYKIKKDNVSAPNECRYSSIISSYVLPWMNLANVWESDYEFISEHWRYLLWILWTWGVVMSHHFVSLSVNIFFVSFRKFRNCLILNLWGRALSAVAWGSVDWILYHGLNF